MIWALTDVLQRYDFQVQVFLSQARFVTRNEAGSPAGQTQRHLDSWVMSPDACREVFVHGMRSADLGLVEGQFHDAAAPRHVSGGDLDTLCDWLALSKLAIVDAGNIDGGPMPALPAGVDAVLLDRVDNDEPTGRIRTRVESLLGVPVLGTLGKLPQIRPPIAALSCGARPPQELCRVLGDELLSSLHLKRLLHLATRTDFPEFTPTLFRSKRYCEGLTVAVAYDEAFCRYFPDTLELLELGGAAVKNFSPLRDDCLPAGADLVYFGCGHPERVAAQLAGNHCMSHALRRHVARGGRVYAEGGGLAYLCRFMVPDGVRALTMTGVLPAVAWYHPNPSPLQPVELTLARGNWLGEARSRLRGYLNCNWLIQPMRPLTSYVVEPEHQLDLVGTDRIIGSRLYLNFASRPRVLRQFLLPSGPPPKPSLAVSQGV